MSAFPQGEQYQVEDPSELALHIGPLPWSLPLGQHFFASGALPVPLQKAGEIHFNDLFRKNADHGHCDRRGQRRRIPKAHKSTFLSAVSALLALLLLFLLAVGGLLLRADHVADHGCGDNKSHGDGRAVEEEVDRAFLIRDLIFPVPAPVDLNGDGVACLELIGRIDPSPGCRSRW